MRLRYDGGTVGEEISMCQEDSKDVSIAVTAVFDHTADDKVLKLEGYSSQVVGGGVADEMHAYSLSAVLIHQSAALTDL